MVRHAGLIPPAYARDSMSPGVTRTMIAVMVLHARFGRVTVREVMLLTGRTTPSVAHAHLNTLRSNGLVDWIDGQQATIHPTVEVVEGPWSVPLLERS